MASAHLRFYNHIPRCYPAAITASCVSTGGKGPADEKPKRERKDKMGIDELIETLEEMRDSYDGRLGLMVAQQPGWPLAATVEAVTRIGGTVWIATREEGGYAPHAAWKGGEIDSEGGEDED